MNDKKLGRPALEGPRHQIRFKNEKETLRIVEAVVIINEGSRYGESITFNSFVAQAAVRASQEVTGKDGKL